MGRQDFSVLTSSKLSLMRMPLRKYSLFAILAACIPLSAAEVCNEKVASPQSKYIGTFTWQGQTLTVGSTSRGATRTASGNFQATFQVSPTGSSSGTDWLGLGNGAVDDLLCRRADGRLVRRHWV